MILKSDKMTVMGFRGCGRVGGDSLVHINTRQNIREAKMSKMSPITKK